MNQLSLALLPWIVAAISLSGFLGCYFCFQKDLRALNKGRRADAMALDEVKQQIVAIREEREEAKETLVVRTGMNLDKRTQALRQMRQGQDSEIIARSLEISKAEVDLLIKVQRLVAQPS